MKETVYRVVKWITILGNLGVLIGFFLPVAVGEHLITGQRYIGVMLSVFFEKGYVDIKVLLLIVIIAIVISFVALKAFIVSKNIGSSIVMLVTAFVGMISFELGSNGMYAIIDSKYISVQRSIGVIMPKIIYIVLIVVAIFALGIEIYNNYVSKHFGGMMVPMGALRCPKCGKKVSGGSKFCVSCGSSLDMLRCPKCGTERDLSSQFCKECGTLLPAIHVEGTDFVGYGSEERKSALEQRVWDSLLITLTLMSLFAILTVVLSLFFPYANTYDNIQDYLLDEGETVHRLIHVFGYEVSGKLKTYLAIMGIAVVVSHVALVWFGKCIDLKASIVMFIASVVGRFFLGMYKKELFVRLRVEFSLVKEAMGVRILDIAYIVLIVASVIALGMDIYNGIISNKKKAGTVE